MRRLANEQIDQLRTEIFDAVKQLDKSESLDKISTKLSLLADKALNEEVHDFLRSLGFGTRTDRQANIVEAHSHTFEWIYGDANGHDMTRPQCHTAYWLHSGKDVYWVSGQAGSGKSTLMRYIFDNSRNHNLLQTWVSKKPLLLRVIFFGTLETYSRSLSEVYCNHYCTIF